MRHALGFDRVPHRRTLERRLDATLPGAIIMPLPRGRQRRWVSRWRPRLDQVADETDDDGNGEEGFPLPVPIYQDVKTCPWCCGEIEQSWQGEEM